MTVGILTEKPSQARHFADALGGMKGTHNGEAYVIVAARGHLYELAQPDAQVASGDAAAYKAWVLANLPWDHRAFAWKRKQAYGAGDTLKTIKTALSACDELVVATDVDPTGEGGLIAAEIFEELGLVKGKKLSRMYFTDEAPASIQKAFKSRKTLPSLAQFDEYLMAEYRNRFDFLSMQFTRVFTIIGASGAVLRQGRLKSAMVSLVGDQLAAYTGYVKTSAFQRRFRDENGVLYTDPAQPVFAAQAQVPGGVVASKVVVDARTAKRTAPRRLLDLAALSARLSSKGVKADHVLATYQKMYEDQVVSYPRTEDKTITGEQFKELLPLVDKIAAVVGVDPGILTQRTPRKTHVKDTGAHGANRPGPKVPPSLDALKSKYGPAAPMIYEELARSYLAMLAEDYLYESQEGHLETYPTFLGRVSVPKSQGWKAVFSLDDSDADSDENTGGLGTVADPVVFEIIPPRPEHPSMKWLMRQLEKRDVGTGATRTSTYAEVTKARSDKNKYPLLSETRGRITMTEFGDQGYRLLPGTRIGDLSVTEQVYATMRAIAEGKTTADAELAVVADWVREDIKTVEHNAPNMRKDLGVSEQTQQKEKFEGAWTTGGKHVSFSREVRGHRFTDQECEDLLAGKTISIECKKNDGSGTYDCHGKLADLEYKGYSYVGFDMVGFGRLSTSGKPLPPATWCKHTFTADEKADLEAGKKIYCDDFVWKSGKKGGATVHWGEENGDWKIIPEFAPRD